ncbi:hypothetical protein TruAng_007635 [Truncatella angustata]|nr:hypothetical protein TruAng_007635 [Truncatella angustata]
MAATSRDHSLDDQSHVGRIQAVLWVGSILSTLAVGLRFFTRLHLLNTFGYEDFFMAVSQVLTMGSAVAIGLESKWGLGRHQWTISDEFTIPYMKAFYSSVVVYNVAACFLKISILFQYRRIFAGRTMQRLTLIGLIFETVWAVTLSFLLPLTCIPVAAFWDTSIEGHCLNQLHIWYLMAAMNLATDFIIFGMPIPVINRLHLAKKQKIMLMLVFCLGFFTCIISVIRLRTLNIAANTTDPTWDNADAAIWSFLELIIGVLAACLPTLRPLYAKVLPHLFGSTTSQTGPSSSHFRQRISSALPKSQSRTIAASVNQTSSESTEKLKLDQDDLTLKNNLKGTQKEDRVYAVATPFTSVSLLLS